MKGRLLFLLAGILLGGAAIVVAQDRTPQPISSQPSTDPAVLPGLPVVQVPEAKKADSLEAQVEQLRLIQVEKEKLNTREQALITNVLKLMEERRNEMQRIEQFLNSLRIVRKDEITDAIHDR
jgi:hypothetical protein